MEYKDPKKVILELLREEKETLELARVNRQKALARITEQLLEAPKYIQNSRESIKEIEIAIRNKTKEIRVLNQAIKLVKTL